MKKFHHTTSTKYIISLSEPDDCTPPKCGELSENTDIAQTDNNYSITTKATAAAITATTIMATTLAPWLMRPTFPDVLTPLLRVRVTKIHARR